MRRGVALDELLCVVGVWQALCLCAVCVLFVSLHASVGPMRCAESQTLQTVLLCSLTILAATGIPFGTMLEKAVVSVALPTGEAAMPHLSFVV